MLVWRLKWEMVLQNTPKFPVNRLVNGWFIWSTFLAVPVTEAQRVTHSEGPRE